MTELIQILTGLLPEIEAEDAALFSPKQREILRVLLRHLQSTLPPQGKAWNPQGVLSILGKLRNPQSELPAWGKTGHASDLTAIQKQNSERIVAVLHALGKIGDRDDVPAIQQMMQAATDARADPYLIQAAREAVTQIEMRLSQQNQAQTLLRGTDKPQGMLLIPATPQPSQTDPEQLLRAENGEGEE